MVKIRSVAWSDHFTCSAKICVNQGICVYVQILTYWIEGRWRICPELGLDFHNAFLGNLTTGFLTVSPQYVWFSALQTREPRVFSYVERQVFIHQWPFRTAHKISPIWLKFGLERHCLHGPKSTSDAIMTYIYMHWAFEQKSFWQAQNRLTSRKY